MMASFAESLRRQQPLATQGIHLEENGQQASGEWTDLATDLDCLHSPPAASLGRTITMRGAVLASLRAMDTGITSASQHSSTGDMSLMPAATVQLAAQTGSFRLRGELMHAYAPPPWSPTPRTPHYAL